MNIVTPDYPQHAALETRDLSVVKYLIIHHSATPTQTTPLEIDAMHRARKFVMIGYHYLIDQEGVVYAGRPIDCVPAAAEGLNTASVNVCMIGNFQADDPGYTGQPTHMSLTALITLGIQIHQDVPSIDQTIGHRDAGLLVTPTYVDACPGQELYNQLPYIKSGISSRVLVR